MGWRRLPLSAILTLLVLFGACSRTVPIYNVVNAPVDPAADGNMDRVAQTITKAGTSLGWRIQPIRPGLMTGTILVRGRHLAVVDIPYDAKTFSITYKQSEKLLQRDNEIHKNYNKWIKALEHRIQGLIGPDSP